MRMTYSILDVSEDEVDLTALECVRSWRLCATEPSERSPNPDKTTSVKLYKDGEKVYIAGDYTSEGAFACNSYERDVVVMLQTIEDNRVQLISPVIEQDVGYAGKLNYKHLSSLVREGTGVEVCKGVGNHNKSLVNKLTKVKELIENDNLFIVGHSFENSDLLVKLLGLLSNRSDFKDVHQDFGLLYALATGVNYLFKPKTEGNNMKLPKTLQHVDLDTLGKFVQRISSVGYTTYDLQDILEHEAFKCEQEVLVERLDTVGKFIQRTVSGEYSLENLKVLLSLKYGP